MSLIGINPFIATVGTGFILLGIDFLATPNTYIQVGQAGFDVLGAGSWLSFPFKGMILLASLIFGEAVLAKTVYGRHVYAVGANPTVCRLSGLPVGRIIASTYVVSGLCMGIAGCLAASQLSTAQARMEPTIVYDVIAAVVIGGTSASRGRRRDVAHRGRPSDHRDDRQRLHAYRPQPHYDQGIVKGVIIIWALAIDGWTSRIPRYRRGEAPFVARQLIKFGDRAERRSYARKATIWGPLRIVSGLALSGSSLDCTHTLMEKQ